jgi:hypothetical protein
MPQLTFLTDFDTFCEQFSWHKLKKKLKFMSFEFKLKKSKSAKSKSVNPDYTSNLLTN